MFPNTKCARGRNNMILVNMIHLISGNSIQCKTQDGFKLDNNVKSLWHKDTIWVRKRVIDDCSHISQGPMSQCIETFMLYSPRGLTLWYFVRLYTHIYYDAQVNLYYCHQNLLIDSIFPLWNCKWKVQYTTTTVHVWHYWTSARDRCFAAESNYRKDCREPTETTS